MKLPLATSASAPRTASVMAWRNATVFGASAITLGLLMLYPTSTNGGGHRGLVQVIAKVGVVTAPVATRRAITDSGSGGAARPVAMSTVVNGTSIDTQFGPVQVQLTIRGRHIASATAIVYPQGSGMDQQINGYAIPQLQQETLAAQSAHIDSISGATYTSGGYVQSLQSALDAAHLG